MGKRKVLVVYQCGACHGKGTTPLDKYRICPVCHGEGVISVEEEIKE